MLQLLICKLPILGWLVSRLYDSPKGSAIAALLLRHDCLEPIGKRTAEKFQSLDTLQNTESYIIKINLFMIQMKYDIFIQ